MGLILQNLFNIKGMSAGQDGILSKDKPADSGQILQNLNPILIQGHALQLPTQNDRRAPGVGRRAI